MFANSKLFFRRVSLAVAGAGAVFAATKAMQYSNNRSIFDPSSKATIEENGPELSVKNRSAVSLEAIYKDVLSDAYEERGELDLGEEYLTIAEDIFAQIGVIEPDGMQKLFDAEETTLTSADKFVDLGSGVGNLCMWVFANTPAKDVVGVEFIPSRHNAALRAKEVAERIYPEVFSIKGQNQAEADDKTDKGDSRNTNIFARQRSLSFVNANLAEKHKSTRLTTDGLQYTLSDSVYRDATVYFTHSWVFDDDLLNKIGDVVMHSSPKARLLVTSRRIPIIDAYISEAKRNGQSAEFEYRGLVHCHADWNDEAPFHIYKRTKGGAV